MVDVDSAGRMLTVEIRPEFNQLYSSKQVKTYVGAVQEALDVLENISEAIGPWRRDHVPPKTFETYATEVIANMTLVRFVRK